MVPNSNLRQNYGLKTTSINRFFIPFSAKLWFIHGQNYALSPKLYKNTK